MFLHLWTYQGGHPGNLVDKPELALDNRRRGNRRNALCKQDMVYVVHLAVTIGQKHMKFCVSSCIYGPTREHLAKRL
jgi:hypothetical protein